MYGTAGNQSRVLWRVVWVVLRWAEMTAAEGSCAPDALSATAADKRGPVYERYWSGMERYWSGMPRQSRHLKPCSISTAKCAGRFVVTMVQYSSCLLGQRSPTCTLTSWQFASSGRDNWSCVLHLLPSRSPGQLRSSGSVIGKQAGVLSASVCHSLRLKLCLVGGSIIWRTLVCGAGAEAASALALLTDTLILLHDLGELFNAAFGPAIVCPKIVPGAATEDAALSAVACR